MRARSSFIDAIPDHSGSAKQPVRIAAILALPWAKG
jgi:hypothetical protein